jgi:ferredoxin hydrogenase large subunit/hydrogenase large subunit
MNPVPFYGALKIMELIDMAEKVQINPFTRIEGHLAVSLEVEHNRVTGAQCSGEMFRGLEQILRGRSPLDSQQITQRICGMCPVSQGIASVLAQESAYGVTVPKNGRIIRNIMLAGNYIQNHITHFYHLSALDFIDIKGVLDYSGDDRLLQEIKKWVESEVKSKRFFPAAPFLPRYEAKYLENHEVNMSALRNYFTGLDMRATAHQLVAIFAGKMPHMATLVPGGVTEKVTSKKIALCRSKLLQLKNFFESSYINDVLAVAGEFPEYFRFGKGCGNFMSYGVFPDVVKGSGRLFPAGVIMGGRLESLDLQHITEEVRYSKYSNNSGFRKTVPEPHKPGAYSWIKAPRYNNQPIEVGPLARVLVAYESGDYPEVTRATDNFLRATGRSFEDLDSCLGRHAARVIELQVIFDHLERWIELLDPMQPTCVDFQLPQKAEGVGLTEAPRGALGHWLAIENGKISSYDCIVPTTWNCSPRDDRDVSGPVEQALIGTEVVDKDNPMEATRIVRAFDPCLACAVH